MAKYTFIVLSNPVTGREQEFNEWYDDTHLGELLSVDGLDTAQRFRRVQRPGSPDRPDGPYEYLAVYEADTDDPERFLAGMASQAAKSHSNAIDLENTVAWWFEAITDKRDA